MKKSAIVFLLFSFLLSSCGAKKNVAMHEQELTVAQRFKAGEIKMYTKPMSPKYKADSVKMEKCSGHYSLAYQCDSAGHTLDKKHVDADSLILTADGHYWKFKRKRKVDYGTYLIRAGRHTIRTCIDLNLYDDKGNIIAPTSEPAGGIMEYPIPDGYFDMIIDMQSHKGETRSFWVRRFSDDGIGVHYRLIFIKDINTPGCWKVFSEENQVVWI